MSQPMTTQEIVTAASASMQDDGDIRTRVHDLTLSALRERRLEASEVRAVVRSVAEGVSLGAEQQPAELMLFQIRQADGSIDPFSSGTLVYPDGSTRALKREDFTITVTDT